MSRAPSLEIDRPLSLTEGWRLRFDADDRGRGENWQKPSHAEESDDPQRGWAPISIPSSWNHIFGDETPDIAWYRCTIAKPDCALSHLRLRFPAVATDCEVFINGTHIGGHSGNWTPFEFDLTEHIEADDLITIVLRVDRVRPAPESFLEGGRRLAHGHPTKGFHDILSKQVCGIWQAPELRTTTDHFIAPNDAWAQGDHQGNLQAGTGDRSNLTTWRLEVTDSTGRVIAERTNLDPTEVLTLCATDFLSPPVPWHPDDPVVYRAMFAATDERGNDLDRTTILIAFRTFDTHAHHIRLNHTPIYLSGILDWGHEPHRIMPNADPDELRRRFRGLKERGINTVCVCLWYPPQHFYDIAAQEGIILWQEHPIWKSPMAPVDTNTNEEAEALRAMYKHHFDDFFRMDRSRPAVGIVAGSCEHERFDPELADWWWTRANRDLPNSIKQVQTAFIEWTDLTKTELYDEHTYENAGPWVDYLKDLDDDLADLGASHGVKPIALGESVMYVDWPDTERLRAFATSRPSKTRNTEGLPWWSAAGLGGAESAERWIEQHHGEEALSRFRHDAHRFCLKGRKFQTEQFRRNPAHGALVHNHLRDVPVCPLGFMDDTDHWRFDPGSCLPWLSRSVLLFEHEPASFAFVGGESAQIEIMLAWFEPEPFDGELLLTITSDNQTIHAECVALAASPGECTSASFTFPVPSPDRVTSLTIRAELADDPRAHPNAWDAWILPPIALTDSIAAADALPFTQEERAPVFEEKRYSSGWGLPMRRWKPEHPDPKTSLGPSVLHDLAANTDPTAEVVVTHRLTGHLIDWLEQGGRLILLPSRAAASGPTTILNAWSQSPFIASAGPLTNPIDRCVLDLLDLDLRRRWVLAIPTGDQGIADRVTPFIRHFVTHEHDGDGSLSILDSLAATRIGRGLLVMSTLDHHTRAGRWLLTHLANWLGGEDATSKTISTSLDTVTVRSWLE